MLGIIRLNRRLRFFPVTNVASHSNSGEYVVSALLCGEHDMNYVYC